MINTRFFPNFKDNKYDFLPVEQPDEFESESVHSTGNGRENKVQIYAIPNIFPPNFKED